MPSDRKCFHQSSLIEVSFRAEEGLPLVATPYMRVVIESILARAVFFGPVRIVAFVVMGNHIHILLVVLNPAHVSRFKEYLKRELAHAINHFKGIPKRTVWCGGCDDPVILDYEKALKRFTYIYSNPQRANLEETIDRYPNLSSWKAFLEGGSIQTVKRITRDSIPALPKRTLSMAEQQQIADELLAAGLEEYELMIEPDAWMECFPESQDADPEVMRETIISNVRNAESELSKDRKGPVVGAHALKLESIWKAHTPKKFGKRMLCLATLKSVRLAYIAWRKGLHQEAAEAYRRWCDGDPDAVMPPGMFWPGGRLGSPCTTSIHAFC